MVASDSLHEVKTNVVVLVRDLNDLPPKFEKNVYDVTIVEETTYVDRPLIKVSLEKLLF